MSKTVPRVIGKTPKLQQICAQLCEIASELGPDEKMPTAIQLRDTIGVSMATLNTALGELEKQHVITRRHGVGIFVSSQLGFRTLALLCDSSSFRDSGRSPFYDLLFDALRARALSHRESIEFHFTQPHGAIEGRLQRALADDIRSGRIAGVIGVGLSNETTHWLATQNVPFVALFGPAFDENHVSVDLNIEKMVQEGAGYLLRSGCDDFEIWDTRRHSPSARIFAALKAISVTWDEANYFFAPVRAADGKSVEIQTVGFERAMKVWSGPRSQWPQGLLICNDMMTHGVLMAWQKLGVRVGTDVHLATHTNAGSAVLLGHTGTWAELEYHPVEVVNTILTYLEALMRGERAPRSHIAIEPRFGLRSDSS